MPLLQHALWELLDRRHGLWIKAENIKPSASQTGDRIHCGGSLRLLLGFERARVPGHFPTRPVLDEAAAKDATRAAVC
ncbi:MAG: hypothetical protein IPL71_03980 [Anaerolineales bacterium]|uniref:hypothetical protein n=1 Tax=Candidatus Villigracilis proximus TaxID=3140683 RepID=UPI003134FFF9|nr:hypothetical protein [Anaerolineales bacterium]